MRAGRLIGKGRAVIGLATHPVWLEMTRGFGPSGPMLAPLFTFSVMAAVLVALIRWRVPRAAAAWPRAEGRAALFGDRKAWRHFLATSAASLFSLTEWLFWEAVCFRVGALGTIPLSAYSVGYSLEPCLFMLAIGLSTALTNAVGGHLGGRAHPRRVCACAAGVCATPTRAGTTPTGRRTHLVAHAPTPNHASTHPPSMPSPIPPAPPSPTPQVVARHGPRLTAATPRPSRWP